MRREWWLLAVGALVAFLAVRSHSQSSGGALPNQTTMYALAPKGTYPVPADLCYRGHQRKRLPDCRPGLDERPPYCIDYGGLPRKRGFQRDHYISEGLCRGQSWCDVAAQDPSRPPGPDNAGNVWYEEISEARKK